MITLKDLKDYEDRIKDLKVLKIGDTIKVEGTTYLLVENNKSCIGCAFQNDEINCTHPDLETNIGCSDGNYKFIEK